MLKNLILLSFLFLLAHSCRTRCQTGWTQINRTLGTWCVQLYPLSSGAVTQAEAQAECAKENAVLSSIEDFAEFIEFNTLLVNADIDVGFLGAELSPNCSCAFSSTVFTCPSTSECGITSAYVWTDNFTVGTTMLVSEYFDFPGDVYEQFLVIYGDGMMNGYYVSSGIGPWTDNAPANKNYTAAAICGRKAE